MSKEEDRLDLFEPASDSKGAEITNINLSKYPKAGVEGEKSNTYRGTYLNGNALKSSYFSLHQIFGSWLYLKPTQHEALDVVLSWSIDRLVPGDPSWGQIVGPSGGAKTAFLRSLNRCPHIFTMDDLTPQTLVTGKTKKDPKTGEVTKIGGLLYKLNGKVVIFKDFTVILSKRPRERNAIFGQFRSAADGYHEKGFGSLEDVIRPKATFGMIMGVTSAIDKYRNFQSMLGERYLKVRMHPRLKDTTEMQSYRKKTAKKARGNRGKEERMRRELQEAVLNHLISLDLDTRRKRGDTLGNVTKEQGEEIDKMAEYVSLMRCWIYSKVNYRGELIDMDLPEPEVPTRLAKAFEKLAVSLMLIRGHEVVTIEDMNTVRRVAQDTTIPKRRILVNTILEHEWGAAGDLAFFSGLHHNSVLTELAKMKALGILREKKDIDGKQKVTFYEFSDEFKPLVESVKPREA